MSEVVVDGIRTRYELVGSGPPLLMFSPGGFDARLESWSTVGSYVDLDLVSSLSKQHTCVLFDRRESGLSGGRVERIGWPDYVRQALGLLNALAIERAHLIGGCIGCSGAAALAAAAPERVASMVLYAPAGGVHYRRQQHQRFATHLAYVAQVGMAGVVSLARSGTDGFSVDPRVGPWAPVLRGDDDFAATYAGLDPSWYATVTGGMATHLFDRDTVPGVEPEDLLVLDVPALIVPGEDTSHTPSAAHYLRECLQASEFWGVPVADRTAASIGDRLLTFLGSHS
jgi:pimeloyl-ACP methyl ester carboxylesterase